tara:strand:- start:341 stop:535 length:195 start_codon:yes stop_codon:yes gene_type:complete
MTIKGNAQFAVARRGGMDPAKASKMAEENLAADDLYVYCMQCGVKRVGTIEKLKEDCSCAKDST